MPLIPALGRQRQANLYEFEVNLVYRVSFRIARAVIQRNRILNPALPKEVSKIAGDFYAQAKFK